MTQSRPDVVVGVDGSTSSQHALRWAHTHCTRRQQPLTALLAWHDDNELPSVNDNKGTPSHNPAMQSFVDSLVDHAVGE